MKLDEVPRVPLGRWPTPVDFAPRLTAALGGPEIWIKRDDLLGLGLGGNKVRKLEFLVADALNQGADTLITTGAAQSNHARLTAAAANRFGLRAILVLRGGAEAPRRGNLLLDDLLGGEVRLVDVQRPGDTCAYMEALAEELRGAGLRPYLIPVGGSNLTGATGYVTAIEELVDQVDELGLPVSRVFHASSSGGTQAGLLAGATWLAPEWEIVGVDVDGTPEELRSGILALATAIADRIETPRPKPAAVHVLTGYVGEGYGILTDAGREAIELVARTEGIFLDPVYTGKAMAGLIGEIRSGRFSEHEAVVFVHTGGTPALFA